MRPMKPETMPARFVALVTRLESDVYIAGECYMEWLIEYAPTMQDAGDLQFRESPPVPSDVWGDA